MSSVCSTLVNTVVIRRDPGLALECLKITTSLIRSILGISTSLCLFCYVGWYMLLVVLELFRLSTCTSLPLLDWALLTMPTSVKVYIVEIQEYVYR